MPILIKNAQIQRAIDFEIRNQVKTKDAEAGAAVFRNSTSEEIGMNMLWGYVSSLIEISEFPELGRPLDLTYGTLSHIVDVVSYQYLIGPNAGYTEERNLEIAEKAVAAYMTFLAANEHGYRITVRQAGELSRDVTGDGELWTGFEIKVGHTLYQADLLKTVHGRIYHDEGTLYLRLDELRETYRLLTGKDPGEYGIGNIRVHFRPKGT